MHFHKFLHPANFEFIRGNLSKKPITTQVGRYRLQVEANPDDIYHITVSGGKWSASDAQVKLRLPKAKRGLAGNKTRLAFHRDGSVALRGGKDGTTYLRTRPDRFFGQCGDASLFEFIKEEGDQFYGLGEKWTGFEHSGKSTKFWNTDAYADFHLESCINLKPAPDPAYVSVPYLIIKRKNTYLGLLLDNPHAAFISTGHRVVISNQKALKTEDGAIHIGAEQGQPSSVRRCPNSPANFRNLSASRPSHPPGPLATTSAAGVTSPKPISWGSTSHSASIASLSTASGSTSITWTNTRSSLLTAPIFPRRKAR